MHINDARALVLIYFVLICLFIFIIHLFNVFIFIYDMVKWTSVYLREKPCE